MRLYVYMSTGRGKRLLTLPEPVCAQAMMSRPPTAIGTAACWTGVGTYKYRHASL